MHDDAEVALICSGEELRTLIPEWNELFRQDRNSTPFQSPQWLLPWWNRFGTEHLRSVTIRRQGRLVGFIPAYVYADADAGERKLLFVGAGTGDYLDGLFAPECRPEDVRQAIALLASGDDWDRTDLLQMRSTSMLLDVFSQLAATDRFASDPCSRMPAVSMAQLPTKIRRNAMYYRNRAARTAKLELVTATADDCLGLFDALVRLHSARWEQKQEPGVLSDPRVLAWHREAIPLLASADMLRLRALLLEAEPIAVMYGVCDPPGRPHRTEYLYLPGISVQHADLRPGTVLMALACEAAAEEGIEVIDLLRGDENYKRLWHAEPVFTWGISRRSTMSRESAEHGGTEADCAREAA